MSDAVEIEEIDSRTPWEIALAELEDDPGMIRDALRVYLAEHPRKDTECTIQRCCPDQRVAQFIKAANKVLSDSLVLCTNCNTPEWEHDAHTDSSGTIVCDECRSSFSTCDRCSEWNANDDGLTWVGDAGYCSPCRDAVLGYCDDCDEYYHVDYSEDHRHGGCDCLPQPLQFSIPANSHGTISEDERLLVELPEGHLSEEAIEAVISLLWYQQFSQAWQNATYEQRIGVEPTPGMLNYEQLREVVEGMDKMWQTKRGNFTRRLSKALHDAHGVKLNPGLLSKAGSTVREHAGNTNKWFVEFTRDLNQSAAAFYHEDSCWWSSEGQSLCALKNWGGLGMRTYSSEDSFRERPTGRAWVQPLNENLQPTRDVLNAHAYIVYNGYGALEGYNAARLVAYLTSRTYKKLPVGISYQYVNSESGYLIADQETCDKTQNVVLNRLSYHEVVAA